MTHGVHNSTVNVYICVFGFSLNTCNGSETTFNVLRFLASNIYIFKDFFVFTLKTKELFGVPPLASCSS